MTLSVLDLQELIPPSVELPWEQDVVAMRRDFHANPELGFEEVRTAGIVASRLKDLGLEVHTGVGVTGVVGVLRGDQPGPCVLVRADMDALPIEEENDWSWKSSKPGKMHACGHDCHTAIALTVARLLAAERSTLRGTIKFMFQPAEEGLGGARAMIEDGVLEDGKFGPRPDLALGLHMWGAQDFGQIGIGVGPSMASGDFFTIRISGKGGHGAHPHQTVDPIVVAGHLLVALQTIVSRNVNPLEPAVVTVGKMTAGSAFNVIPMEATLEGTVRAYDEDVRDLMERRCHELVEELPRAFGATGEIDYERKFPVLRNDAGVAAMVRRAAVTVAGEENILPFQSMGSEDFADVLNEIPGCFFYIGARNEEIGATYPHHHPKFNVDERALAMGVQVMMAAVSECLESINLKRL